MAKDQNPRLGRVNFIYGMVFVALSSLILRLGYLQIARGAEFRNAATTTMLVRQPVLPARGWIYDSNGVLLAYHDNSYTISISRLHSPDQNFDAIAEILAHELGMTKQDFLNLLNSPRNKDQLQVTLLENATEQQVAFVKEHQSQLVGVHVDLTAQRKYKYGDLAGHVLGYVGAQSEKERPAYAEKGYYIDQKVGKDGVEKQYEDLLQGSLGYKVVETNNLGIPIKDFGLDQVPQMGNTLQLTIDAKLQANAQNIVMNGLQAVSKKFGYTPNEASAILIEPNTGAVKAMVSYPYYNPQWFLDSKAYTAHLSYINNPKLTPTLNHAIGSYHEPGSTVKPVNLIASLMSKVIAPSSTIFDPGFVMVGTTRMKDDVPGGHGHIGPVRAIQVSCDTFFYTMGLWLAKWHGAPPSGESVSKWLVTDQVKGLNTLYGWEYKFGLGPKTGIDLPYEVTGKFYRTKYLPDSGKSVVVPYHLQESQNSIKKTGSYAKHGMPYDNAAAGIGQMQAFTPIELAQYISTLATNGKRIQPHVLQAVLPPGSSPQKAAATDVQAVKPKVLDTIKANSQYWSIVRQGMYDAVNKPGGTAYGSFYNAPYKAAGKTGTAQVGQNKADTSVFMAYAPYDKPQIAVVVMVPGGGGSYDTAVPIARQLLDAYFKEQHAPFFPKGQWTNPGPPSNWFQSPAYKVPEEQVGENSNKN